MMVLVLAAGGCSGAPRVSGMAGTSPAPNVPWTPPANLERSRDTSPAAPGKLPPDLAERVNHLTLADIVDIGLRQNPQTRIAWANARSAAASYGAARGARLPTIDADVTASRLQTVASQGRAAVRQSLLNPSVSLSYLVFDLGGRSGSIETARQSLIAADFTHNAVIQDVVLRHRVGGAVGSV
ncbi:MAG: TolC family protein, partial [Gemmatimonadota bacterium]